LRWPVVNLGDSYRWGVRARWRQVLPHPLRWAFRFPPGRPVMARTCLPRVQLPGRTQGRELSARRKISRLWFHRRHHHLAQPPPRRMLPIQAHPCFRRRLPPNMPAAKAMGRRALVRHFLLRQEPVHLPKHRLCRLRQRLCRRKPLLRESLLAQTVAVCPHNWPAGTSTAQAGLTRISVADSTCRHRVI
jgi:hypothetical protein